MSVLFCIIDVYTFTNIRHHFFKLMLNSRCDKNMLRELLCICSGPIHPCFCFGYPMCLFSTAVVLYIDFIRNVAFTITKPNSVLNGFDLFINETTSVCVLRVCQLTGLVNVYMECVTSSVKIEAYTANYGRPF